MLPRQHRPSEEPAGDKVLRVWIEWGDNPQQIQELFDQYTEISGYKVEVTAPIDGHKILPGLTGTSAPDVLVLSGGDLVKSYHKERLVDELSQVIKDGNIDLDLKAMQLVSNTVPGRIFFNGKFQYLVISE